MNDLTFASATVIAEKIRNKDVSPREILQHYLDRVDRYNAELNIVVVDDRERALAASDAPSLTDKAPFSGVPMTVKESFNLVGHPTTWGNPEWRDNVADTDAVAVSKLKAAGANIFGKTNVPLALADLQSYNDVYGTTNNPYDLQRGPGGSSGGSAAALAAGFSALELGSDIGGSIRNPAHFCGVFGHKPTHNLLVMRGHAPPEETRAIPDISVIGPLARSAQDLDAAMRVLAGPDEIMARGYRLDLPEWKGRSVNGLRVAVWSNDEIAPVTKEVTARVEQVAQALADAGASVNHCARPDFSAKHSHNVYQNLLQATMASRMAAEEYASLQAYVADMDPEDTSHKATVMRAQVASFRDWSAYNELRHQLRWAWHAFFEDYDVLLTPVTASAAFPHDHGKFGDRTIDVDNNRQPYFDQVFWAGLTGVSFLPSTIVPTGLNDAGLPIGVQIVGPEYADLITIGVATELEQAGFSFVPPPRYV